MAKVIIQVSGGLVQAVFTSEPVEIVIIDYDNIKAQVLDFEAGEDEKPEITLYTPDQITSDLSGLYSDEKKDFEFIQGDLQKLGF